MSLAQHAAAGAKWSAVSVAGRHVVIVITSVILARLLSPSDFGLVAMASVFIRFIELVRDIGTGAGIVQVDRPSNQLLSSVFWLNAALGVAAGTLLIVLAPVAAALFREPRLTAVLKVLALSPLFGAFSVVHTSLLTRDFRFRRLAVVELSGVLVGGVVGIGLAVNGYAVWSLVWQSICTVVFVSAGTCVASGWRPRFTFRLASVKPILGYSANLTGFNILNYFVRYADNLLIGRYLGARDLGSYDLAYRLMLSPLQYVATAFGRVLFPVYTRMRDDPRRLSDAYLKVASGIATIAFPIMFGLAGVADVFVDATFGPQWAPVAALLLILGPLGALQSITTSLSNIYLAVGRTDLLLRWGAGIGILIVTSFVVGLRWGVVGVASAYAIVSCAVAYYQFKIPLSLVGLRVVALAEAIGRPLVCSLFMLASVLLLKRALPAGLDSRMVLAVLVMSGMALYAVATWVFNRESTTGLMAVFFSGWR